MASVRDSDSGSSKHLLGGGRPWLQMSLSYLWQQVPALNQAGELISLKNTPGKTRGGSARWQRQGHANTWLSTRWRERLRGGSRSPACTWAGDQPQASKAGAVLCCLCQAEGSSSRDRDLQPAPCLPCVPQNSVPASPWSRGQTATEEPVCMC